MVDTQNQDDLQTKMLWPFFFLTFAICWSLIGAYIFLPKLATQWFGELSGTHPFFFLAVYAPAISAFLIITYCHGISGIRNFLSRLALWKVSAYWWVFIVLGIPLVFFIGSLIKGNLGEFFSNQEPFSSVVGLLIMRIFLGPVEEFGWRGLALPLLQRKITPLIAALSLGLVWGIWHLPAFFLSSMVHSQWGFIPFLIGNVCLSIIFTALYNASKGSLLLAAIFHYQLINPIWPDAQPYDTVCFAVVAIAVVFLNKKTMLSNEKACRTVIPGKVLSLKAEA